MRNRKKKKILFSHRSSYDVSNGYFELFLQNVNKQNKMLISFD